MAERVVYSIPNLMFFEIQKAITNIVACRVVALDLRGHGDTTTLDDSDLSTDTLSK